MANYQGSNGQVKIKKQALQDLTTQVFQPL